VALEPRDNYLDTHRESMMWITASFELRNPASLNLTVRLQMTLRPDNNLRCTKMKGPCVAPVSAVGSGPSPIPHCGSIQKMSCGVPTWSDRGVRDTSIRIWR